MSKLAYSTKTSINVIKTMILYKRDLVYQPCGVLACTQHGTDAAALA